MIAVDASAIISLLLGEADGPAFARAMAKAEARCMSGLNYMEAAFVIVGRRGDEGLRDLRELVRQTPIDIVAVDRRLADAAVEAFLVYGKGRHPARLNLGDCAAYALAQTLGAPLLFKGDDFTRTDVRAAV